MIHRDPPGAAAREHGLIIVGGGIYGACLALEAARRGLEPLLLERGDFGGATSWNSLRILHGGFRYLQTLDLKRFRESVTERRWFCGHFPELVRPLECLMPLYGRGLKRLGPFRAALALNDALSADRNRGVAPALHLPAGRTIDRAETIERFPLVDRRGLQGAGVWYDAVMVSPQRILVEILRWACHLGATALNYVEVADVERCGRAVAGVTARDLVTGSLLTFRSRLVCNAAGPWAGEMAARFDPDARAPFHASLAFNVLLDRPAPSAAAVAVAPRRQDGDGPVYFMYPAFGRLLAGTVHLPWTGATDRPRPTREQLLAFLQDLNLAIPGLDVTPVHVVRVFSGLLPTTVPGTATLAGRPQVVDHAREGGLEGLVSVSGVKFTTARRVAEQVMSVVERYTGRRAISEPASARPRPAAADVDARPGPDQSDRQGLMQRIGDDPVVNDDSPFRQTNPGLVDPDATRLDERALDAWLRPGQGRSAAVRR